MAQSAPQTHEGKEGEAAGHGKPAVAEKEIVAEKETDESDESEEKSEEDVSVSSVSESDKSSNSQHTPHGSKFKVPPPIHIPHPVDPKHDRPRVTLINLKDPALNLVTCVSNMRPDDEGLNMSLRSIKKEDSEAPTDSKALLVGDLINLDDLEMTTEDGAKVVASTVVEISHHAHQARVLCFDKRHKGGIEEYILDFIHMQSGTQRQWSARNLISVRPADLKERAPIELTRDGGLVNRVKSCYYTRPHNPKKLFIYFVIRKPGRKLRLREMVMIFESKHSVKNVNQTSIEKWLKMLKRFVKTNVKEQDRPTNLLAYLNPYGGKGKAKSIFQYKVMPLLWLAGIKVEAVHTERANHAKEDVCTRQDLDKFNGIMSVGGDGMFNEVMTGLVMRYNSAVAKPFETCTVWTTLVKPELRIGIIPAGSLNALCWSLHGTDDPVTAALHILLGHNRRVDACGIYLDNKLTRLASTMVSFGYLGDALVKSEKMRSIGPVRYRIAGALAALKNTHHGGVVDMEVVFDNDMDTPHKMNDVFASGDEKILPPCKTDCKVCLNATKPPAATATGVSADLDEIVYNVSVTGMFPHIVGAVSICTSRLSPSGLSPGAHLGDGCMHIGIVGNMSWCRSIEFIRQTTLLGGRHMKFTETRAFKVKGFSFRPTNCLTRPDEANLLNVEYLGHGLQMSREHVILSPKPEDMSKRMTGNSLDNMSVSCKNMNNTTAIPYPVNAEFKECKTHKKCRSGIWNIDGEIQQLSKGVLHFRVHQQLMNMFCEGVPPYESELARGCCRKPTADTFRCCSRHHKISTAVDDYYY